MSFDWMAVWHQIGLGVRMSVGARDWVYDTKDASVMFRVGPARPLRKVIVRLNGKDLYDVQIGHMNRRTYEWVTDAAEQDVHAEALAAVVRQLHDDQYRDR